MDISILVTSCSLYKNIWDPFIFLLRKHWSDCDIHIYIGCDKYLSQEEKEKYLKQNINFIITEIEPYAKNYTSRIIDYISKIPTKYIILMQEDILITKKVNNTEIKECYNLLNSNNIFNGIRLHGIGCDSGEGNEINLTNITLREMLHTQKYWFSWATTMWNKDKLMNILTNANFKNLNTEDSETNITNYMKGKNEKILSISCSSKRNIIEYIGIGAINGGIVSNNYVNYLKSENIPIKLYENDCIYDKNSKDLHKYNNNDEYYIKTQNIVIKKTKLNKI